MCKLHGAEFVGEGGFNVVDCVFVGGDVGGDVVSIGCHCACAGLDAGNVGGGEVLFEVVPCLLVGWDLLPFDEGLGV